MRELLEWAATGDADRQNTGGPDIDLVLNGRIEKEAPRRTGITPNDDASVFNTPEERDEVVKQIAPYTDSVNEKGDLLSGRAVRIADGLHNDDQLKTQTFWR